jgi:hypothetical protein
VKAPSLFFNECLSTNRVPSYWTGYRCVCVLFTLDSHSIQVVYSEGVSTKWVPCLNNTQLNFINEISKQSGQ